MDGDTTRWTVSIGGLDGAGLRGALEAAGVALNVAAEEILAHPALAVAGEDATITAVAVSVGALGLPRGGCWGEVVAAARGQGLTLCPLAVGPHLRLQWRDQPEAPPSLTRGHAPPGSLTVASPPLAGDGGLWGLYLRRIGGILWLRGYWSDGEHRWDAGDRLVFAEP